MFYCIFNNVFYATFLKLSLWKFVGPLENFVLNSKIPNYGHITAKNLYSSRILSNSRVEATYLSIIRDKPRKHCKRLRCLQKFEARGSSSDQIKNIQTTDKLKIFVRNKISSMYVTNFHRINAVRYL